MLGARLVALFVFVGGSVGALTAWTALFIYSLVSAGRFEFEYLAQFFTLMPFALLIGILIGFVPATLTAWIYASGPKPWRTYVYVASIGAWWSMLAGCVLALAIGQGVDLLGFLGVLLLFALCGALAATACHRIASRWAELSPP